MASFDRAHDAGALNLVSTFLASFPPWARSSKERQLASLDRVREDGVLSVHVDKVGNDRIVRLSGELDIASATKLEDELRRALDSHASVVILDLGGLSFIDSTGLRALLFAAKLSAKHGTRLRMTQPAPPVRQALEISGLEPSLPLAD